MPGFDQDTPILLGEPGGEPTRIRAVRSTGEISVGQAVWVTGTGVAELLHSGAALDITRRKQKRRVFTVGGITYTDERKAKRISSATGQPMIEVA